MGADKERRPRTENELEHKIQRLMWTFEVESIHATREQARKAIEASRSKPLPDF